MLTTLQESAVLEHRSARLMRTDAIGTHGKSTSTHMHMRPICTIVHATVA